MNIIAHATHHTKNHFKQHHKKYLLAGLFSGIGFFTIKIVIVLFGTVGLFQLENTLAALEPDICIGVSTDTGGVSEAECRALIGIYNSTNGDGWKNKTNRGNTGDVCSWYGPSCGSSKTVTSLDLSDNTLDGSLDLSGLPNIVTLNLSKNLGLVGVSGLGSLSNLTSLDLTNIGSSTYPDGLSSLFNLQTLSLQSNNYETFPSIGGLTKLTSINLAGNFISESSFDLSNLSLLNSLDISKNSFSEAPTISNSNITTLNISKNNSMTDISNLSSLNSLTTLNASYCAIDNDGLGSFTSLSLDGGSVVENCLTIYETAGDPLYVYLHDNSVDYVSQASCGTIYDSSDPICGIKEYSPSSRTNGTVRAYVECNKPVDGDLFYDFETNGSYIFSFSNTIYDWNGTVNATVSWIEDTDPDCDTVSTQTVVDERVSGSFKCRDIDGGDGVSGIDGYSAGTTERTITFNIAVSDNSTKYKEVCDNAGNCIDVAIPVEGFVLSNPSCTVIKSPSTRTNGDVDVSLSCEGLEPLVGADWTDTFSQNDSFSITVSDAEGDPTTVSATISNIDKVAPTCNPTIQYSPADAGEWIAEDVTATLIGCTDAGGPGTPSTSSEINTSESQTTITFTDSGTGELYVVDNAGNRTTYEAEVTWIDREGPSCPITYDIETPTNGNVVATLGDCGETVTIENNDQAVDYTFTDNGTFTYVVADVHGNTSEIVAEVRNIDRIAPICGMSYDPDTNTSEPVTATLTGCSENVEITNNGGLSGHLFMTNSGFTYEFIDEAGNTGTKFAVVYWIDTSRPVCSISYDPDGPDKTGGDVVAILTGCSKDNITILNNGGLSGYTFTGDSEFIFLYKDALNNTGQTEATVTWIDKSKPYCEIAYSTNKRTTSNVTATLVNCSENVEVTNNEGSISYKFTDDGNFTFNFSDSVGNTGSTYAKVSWISNGGGGGGGVSIDYCPQGDFSPSYYDNTCEGEEVVVTGNYCEVPEDTPYSDELVSAFLRAYDLGITTMCPIERAALEGSLFRNHMAKMISVFSMKILGMMPDMNKECSFADIEDETNEMKAYIQLSCQLGLMGYRADGVTLKENFEPKKVVSRAQFATILSRLLRGNAHDNGDDEFYYTDHITTLKDQKIMSDDYYPPKDAEIRGAMMIMMQKAQIYKKIIEYNSNQKAIKDEDITIRIDSHPNQLANLGDLVSFILEFDGMPEKVYREFGDDKTYECEGRGCNEIGHVYEEKGIYDIIAKIKFLNQSLLQKTIKLVVN